MTFDVVEKRSGNKHWLWITGPFYILFLIAQALGESIKEARGNQPAHIDYNLKD